MQAYILMNFMGNLLEGGLFFASKIQLLGLTCQKSCCLVADVFIVRLLKQNCDYLLVFTMSLAVLQTGSADDRSVYTIDSGLHSIVI